MKSPSWTNTIDGQHDASSASAVDVTEPGCGPIGDFFRGFVIAALAAAICAKLIRGIPSDQPSVLLTLVLESVAAVLLWFFWGRLVCLLGVSVSVGFLVYNAYAFFAGKDCGCFGGYFPRATPVLFDLIFMGGFTSAFLRCHYPLRIIKPGLPFFSIGVGSAAAFLALSFVIGMPATTLDRHQLVWEISSLRDSPLQSLMSIDPGAGISPDQLQTCELALLDFDCDKCIDFHRRWRQDASRNSSPQKKSYFVLLRLKPSPKIAWKIGPGDWTLAEIAKRGSYVTFVSGNPYVQTPLCMELSNGIITRECSQ